MTVVEISIWDDLDPVAKRDALRKIATTERVAYSPEAMWILRWEDVRALLRDRRFEGVGLSVFDLLGITDGPLRRWYGSLMFTNEGVADNRLRSLVQQAFVPLVDRVAPLDDALRSPTTCCARSRPLAAAICSDLGDPRSDPGDREAGRRGATTSSASSRATRRSSRGVFGFMTPEEIEAATQAIEEPRSASTRSLLDTRAADLVDDSHHPPVPSRARR